MATLSEFELIEKLLKPLAAQAPGAFALTDDAALLPDLAPGESYVVTKDALAVGTHMLMDDPPNDMARKALRVNLSDLAAMGARPTGFFMALCLGEDTDQAFLKAFVAGLAGDVAQYSIPLMGGDIIRHQGPFTVSITAFGEVKRDKVLRRNGARAGDSLWVSGTIGDGALGLMAAQGALQDLDPAHKDFLIHRYCVPEPRISLGAALAGKANACIDISDGLVADVGHICEASNIACTIDSSSVPVSPAAKLLLATHPELLELALTGGDDYELAFAIAPGHENHLDKSALTRVGKFEAGTGVTMLNQQGYTFALSQTGYRHD